MRWHLGFPYFLKDLVRLQLDTGPGMYQEEEYIWLLLFPKPPAGEARGKILEARALTSAVTQQKRRVVKF